MDRHQAGQRETMVDVGMETDSSGLRGSPADRRCCFKCAVALATVTGLVVVVLVAGFTLHFFMFTPSCNQEAPPLSDTAKVNITCKLKKSAEQGRYDIFTVDKAATYLIYGWLKLSHVTGEEIVLKQTREKQEGTIQKQSGDRTEIFFFNKVKVADGMTINISLKSAYTDNSFHVYEL